MAKIGDKITTLRERRNISIRELSIRAGVSHSTISLIERNKISPSIDTLEAILESMGSSMAEFFNKIRSDSESPFYRKESFAELGRENFLSYKLIGHNFPNRSIQFLKETYQVGADSGECIAHAAQEAGYIMSGRIELTVGDKVAILEAGDGYYFDSNKYHRFKNVGDCKAEIISAITPPSY